MQRSLDEFAGYEETENVSYTCPSWAPIVGFTGIACAVVFASKYDNKTGLEGNSAVDGGDGNFRHKWG
jgi:hypothetical protein